VKIAILDLNFDILQVCHTLLAELHHSSYCLRESVVSFKSYAMEYFGWETPFGEFVINNSQNFKFLIRPLKPNSIRGAASFELLMTKIGPAVLKLFDSTFMLEIPIPAPK
jgi:hypothetical protein